VKKETEVKTENKTKNETETLYEIEITEDLYLLMKKNPINNFLLKNKEYIYILSLFSIILFSILSLLSKLEFQYYIIPICVIYYINILISFVTDFYIQTVILTINLPNNDELVSKTDGFINNVTRKTYFYSFFLILPIFIFMTVVFYLFYHYFIGHSLKEIVLFLFFYFYVSVLIKIQQLIYCFLSCKTIKYDNPRESLPEELKPAQLQRTKDDRHI
jgi:hypothetical protein